MASEEGSACTCLLCLILSLLQGIGPIAASGIFTHYRIMAFSMLMYTLTYTQALKTISMIPLQLYFCAPS
jgi:hypothetical protein